MISFTQSTRGSSRSRSAGLVILGSLAVAGLTGCSSAGAGPTATPAATATPAPTPTPAPTATPTGGGTVQVVLQEFAVVPAVASIEHGKVTFVATNTGPDDPHEMVIFKTDLGVHKLPASAEGKVDEEGAGLTTMGEIEEFGVGKTGTVTLELAAGRYVLVCNIVQDEPDGTKESHYLKGMSTEFTVK